MKFSQLGQFALASAVSAALVLGITACGQSNTVDFIYVTSAGNNPGNIYAFSADGESGALRQIVGSPFSATGRNPVAIVSSPNGKNLYVVNHDDNTVVEFAVGTDGKIYPENTYPNAQGNISVPGTSATNLALSPDGTALYVVYAYGLDANGNPFSPTTPGVGALARYAVNPDGTLGAVATYPTCNNPVAVAVNSSAVYVVNDPAGQLTTLIDTVASTNRGATGNATVTYPAVNGCSGGTSPKGQISTYSVNSDGSLTAGTGSPVAAGVAPNGIAVDPTNRFVYVTDFQQNVLFNYQAGSAGSLVPISNAPQSPTGNLPSAVTVDPRGQYIYVSNYSSGTVSGFQINATNGAPSALANAGSGQVDPGPAAIIVEPSIGRYIYTADFLGNSIYGLTLDPNTGGTGQVQNSPFPGLASATAVAAVKHGDHAVQINPSYGQ